VERITGRKPGPSATIHCPIHSHDDSSPSFSIGGPNGDTLWKCFGQCNDGGDVLKLFSIIEGYPGADQPGFHEITCPEFAALFGETYKPSKQYDDQFMRRVKMRNAVNYVINHLDRKAAQDFLKHRGWTTKTARLFGIGRITRPAQILRKLTSNYGQETLKDAGLVSKNTGVLPTVLRENNRIIFTIRGHHGFAVGFMGRVLHEDNSNRPKYVNSPTSEMFTKGHLLYNYHRVHNRFDWAYLVEGPSDVITFWQNGIQNAVAPCGTSVTEQHLNLLNKFRKVIVVADLDKAGDTMARRVMKELTNCWFIRLPEDTDPDSYFWDKDMCRQVHTRDDFMRLDVLSPLAWTIEQSSFYHPQDEAVRFIKTIAKWPAVQHDDLLSRLSRKSSIRKEKLYQELDREITRISFRVLSKVFEKKKDGSLSVRVEINTITK